MEITVDIDTRELADDETFCDIVSDIATDVIRDNGEVEQIVTSTIESDIGYHISMYLEDNPMVDPNDDAFINAVAKAILNMARSYVGE
ncbi:MAG: hypothetical protein CL881_05480 [Dehalococcoidia bacterium]|nr:hypothetical protein [Dehalococcoidia bacterium]